MKTETTWVVVIGEAVSHCFHEVLLIKTQHKNEAKHQAMRNQPNCMEVMRCFRVGKNWISVKNRLPAANQSVELRVKSSKNPTGTYDSHKYGWVINWKPMLATVPEVTHWLDEKNV